MDHRVTIQQLIDDGFLACRENGKTECLYAMGYMQCGLLWSTTEWLNYFAMRNANLVKCGPPE